MNSEKQSTNLQMILREVNRVGEGQKNVPKLRFKGYEDAWEQRMLGSAINVRSGKDYKHLDEGDVPVYGTGGYMLSVSEALENTQDAIGIGRKGTIDKPFVLKAPFWTVDTLFYCIPKGNNYLGFLYPLFQSINWKLYDESTGVPSLSKTAIEGVTINLTGKDEQYSIGEYFEIVDTLITLHQRKYDALKTMKKTLLSKMFPKDGEDVPEIRFKGFTDAWEQRILMNILSEYTDEVNALENGYVRLGIRSHAKGTFHTFVQEGKELQTGKMYKVAANKFIVNITFAWEHAVAVTNQNDEGKIVSHRFPQFTISDDVIPDFFKYIILNKQFKYYLGLSSPGGAGRNRVLNIKEMLKYEVRIATESEQEQIYKILSGIDNLITLHQRKLDELKNMKKTLLQQMFV